MSFLGGWTNEGNILFNADAPSTLTISLGTLLNNSKIISDPGGGNPSPNVIDADFGQGAGGQLFVNHDLYFADGNTVDLLNGQVYVGPGANLSFGNSTVYFGGSTNIFGDGTISFDGTTLTTVSIQSNFTYNSSIPDFNFTNGTVNISRPGTETFTVDFGAALTVDDNVTFNVDLGNNGTINFLGTNTVNGLFTNNLGANVLVDGSSPGDLTVGNNFINDGTLAIDNSSAGADVSTVTVTGSFVNNGYIIVQDTNGGIGAGAHTIDGLVSGTGGIMLIDTNLALTTFSTIANTQTIDLGNNELRIPNSASFDNFASIKGNGTIVITSGTFTNEGFLAPDANTATGEVLNVSGDFTAGSSSMLELEVFGALDHDSLDVTGDFTAGGNVQILYMAGHGVDSGDTIQDVISFAGTDLGGVFAPAQHNLGAAYTVTLVNDAIGNYDLTVSSSFNKVFDNDTNLDWDDNTNWDLDALPVVGSDVQIRGDHDVTISSAGTRQINSLSIEQDTGGDTPSLHISDGTLQVNSDSRAFAGTTVQISGTGGLVPAGGGSFYIEGLLDWDNGFIGTGGSNPVDVLGTADIDIGTSMSLDTTLSPRGSATIDGSGNALNGSGGIVVSNLGNVTVKGTTTFNPSLQINQNGIVTLEGNPPTSLTIADGSAVTDLQIFSGGLLILDTAGSGTSNVDLNFDSLSQGANAGTIRFTDSSTADSATRTIVAPDFSSLTNDGKIEVQANGILDIDGSTFDTSNGEISVDASKTLTIAGGTLGDVYIGPGTNFSGSGNVDFTGNVNINLSGNTLLSSPSVYLNTSGGDVTFVGANTLELAAGTLLELHSNDAVNTTQFNNSGTLRLMEDGISITSAFENYGGASLEIIGDSGGPGVKEFATGFTNNGNLTLSQDGTNVLEVSNGGLGTIVNQNYLQSTLAGASGNPNIIKAEVDNNQGATIDVDYDLQFAEDAAATHDNNGEIDIASGATLSIGGTTGKLINHNDGGIAGSGILDVNGAEFENSGRINPGGTGMANSTLTINADSAANTELMHDTEVEIEIDASGHDTLAFTNADPTFGGRIRINNINGFNPTNGQAFNYIVSTVGLMTTFFDYIEGTDQFGGGAGFVYDVTHDAGGIRLTAFDASTIIEGTTGDDNGGALTGTGSGQIFHGDDGNDVILSIGAGDTAFGGDGDDVIHAASNAKRLVGGEGFDQLRLLESVDYRGLPGHFIEEFELLDLDDGASQVVEFDSAAIARFIDEGGSLFEDSLIIMGDASDRVVLHGDFNFDSLEYLDYRNPGTAEEFVALEEIDGTERTGVLFGPEVLVEVRKSDTSKLFYGSSGNDVINTTSTTTQSTGLSDFIHGRDGDDQIDGGGGNDEIFGGDGNDEIVYDPADLMGVDGGAGIDSLLVTGGTINLSGVSHINNIEKISMENGSGTDQLTVGLVDLQGMIGDNSLDTLLPDGRQKIIISGDVGDTLSLDGNQIDNIPDINSLSGGWTAPNGATEANYLGDGEMYMYFTNGLIDLYVHADLADTV